MVVACATRNRSLACQSQAPAAIQAMRCRMAMAAAPEALRMPGKAAPALSTPAVQGAARQSRCARACSTDIVPLLFVPEELCVLTHGDVPDGSGLL